MGCIFIATNDNIKTIGLKETLSKYGTEVCITNSIKELKRQYKNMDMLLIDSSVHYLNFKDVVESISDGRELDVPTYIIRDLNGKTALEDIEYVSSLGVEGFIDANDCRKIDVILPMLHKMKRAKAIVSARRQNEMLMKECTNQQNGALAAQMATIKALVELAESRDQYTGMHLQRVQEVCSILVTSLDDTEYENEVTNQEAYAIIVSSILHDIGKVGVEDRILNKRGKLSKEEFDSMKLHVDIGISTLKKVLDYFPSNSYLETGIEIVAYHHEKWDGTGYPYGLKGHDIPIAGRIMAIADVYDALRSERPYKKPIPHEQSVEIIAELRGIQFDPLLVDIFLDKSEEIDRAYAEISDQGTGLELFEIGSISNLAV